jgi:NAD+ synthase (glutamine-hydrolysing)
MSRLRIALAQINPTVGDLDANAAKICENIDAAKEAGADLVTFPELAICGYPPEDLLLKPRFLHDCRTALDDVVAHARGIAALVGFPDVASGSVYNAAVLIHNRKLVAVYDKVELPNYGVFDEKRYFARGSGYVVFELNGIRTFITICEDIWVEGGPTERSAAKNDSSLVVNLSASPFHAGKFADRGDLLARFARRTSAHLAYTNLVGGQDELVFDGGSMILSPAGALVAAAERFQEDLLLADIRPAESGENDTPRQADGRWERRIVLTSRRSRRTKPVSPRICRHQSREEEVHNALVLGTRDYVGKNGFGQVVAGLSGGIDSSLTACIAVEALGAANVVGVTMPSQYTSDGTLGDAGALAENLGIRLLTIPIEGIFSSYLDDLDEPLGDAEGGLTAENLQARIRGNILMALSNRFGWLVLSCGNKSETAVGYCTLYGDMVGGFAVIKDVPKTLVYRIARHVNEAAERELIPASILDRAPTAELRPDQKDEDTLPPYGQLDPILEAYVEEDRAPDEIARDDFPIERVEEVIRLVDRAEYKRRQAPPGIKITPKAFGRDRRLPITNRYVTPAHPATQPRRSTVEVARRNRSAE